MAIIFLRCKNYRMEGKAMRKLMVVLCFVINANVLAQEGFVFTDRTSENEFNFVWKQFNKKRSNFVDQRWFFSKNVWTCKKININRDGSPNTIDKVVDEYQFQITFDEDHRIFKVPYALVSKINTNKMLLFSYSSYLETKRAVFMNIHKLSDPLQYVSFIKFAESSTFYFANAFNVTKNDEYNEVHNLDYSYKEEHQLDYDPYVINQNNNILAVTSIGVCRSSRR